MHKLYVHPLPVRIWHWINAIGFLVHDYLLLF